MTRTLFQMRIDELRETMARYRDWGAEDSEAMDLFDFIVDQTKKGELITILAEDWQLYDMRGVDQIAQELAAMANEINQELATGWITTEALRGGAL